MKTVKPFSNKFNNLFPPAFLPQLDENFRGLQEALEPYAVTNNYQFTDNDKIDSLQVSAAAGNRVITLPTPNGARRRRVIKTDATANTVTITAGGVLLINGALTYVLAAQFAYVQVEPTGTGWLIVGS